MPRRFTLSAIVALLVLCGCRKSAAPTSATEVPATNAAAPVSEADLSDVLTALTQAVRKYGFEKQKMPKNLEELVASGYLTALPTAPAGKKFSIDEKKVQVVLTGR